MSRYVIRDPTPGWLKDPSVVTGRQPGQANVIEPAVYKALRMPAGLVGADDPQSQVMGLETTGVPVKSALRKVAESVVPKKAGMRAYHGTSAKEPFTSFSTPEAYLTTDPREAAAYATDLIIGGSRGRGAPRIVEAELPPGRGWDIGHAVDTAMANGDNIDTVIAAHAQRARDGGVDYLTFKHPSSTGGDDIDAIVSVRPDRLAIDPPAFTPRPRPDGRVNIVGPKGQGAGVYAPHEVEQSLADLDFGYRRARPAGTLDKSIIDIMRQYGILPAAVGAGAGQALSQPETR